MCLTAAFIPLTASLGLIGFDAFFITGLYFLDGGRCCTELLSCNIGQSSSFSLENKVLGTVVVVSGSWCDDNETSTSASNSRALCKNSPIGGGGGVAAPN